MQMDAFEATPFSFRAGLARGFHLLCRWMVKPTSSDEDEARREFILNVILLGSIGLMLVSDAVVLNNSIAQGDSYAGIPFWMFSLIVAVFVTLYALSRFGYWRYSSFALLLVYFSGATYGVYQWGADLPAALLSYVLIVVMAGILLGTRYGIAAAIVTALAVGLAGYYESSRQFMPDVHWKRAQLNLGDVAQHLFVLFMIVILTWLSNREIEKSLERARRSEAEVRRQRDFLEIKVEERTRALREAQAGRVSELYRMAEFGRLSTGLFHDLMNPLTAISLHVEQLKEAKPADVAKARDQLERMRVAAKRMEHFMCAIRKQLAHHETMEMFPLDESIREVVDLLGYKARKTGVAVRVIIQQSVLHYGNPLKFHQVAQNLVSNAIDACGECGRAGEVQVMLFEDGAHAVLRVKDNGRGIPEEHLPRIFEPFFTTKPSRQGTGIGLSITKDIVQSSLHGAIEAGRVASGGSIFTVRFPVFAAPEPPAGYAETPRGAGA